MTAESRVLSIDELHRLTRTARNGVLDRTDAKVSQQADELWACLLETTRSSTVSDKHMTAACNALCFVVRADSSSQDAVLRARAYDPETWRQMFVAARSAFASGKNKPAIQVLETLHYLAESNPDHGSVVEIVEEAAIDMARIVLSHYPRRSLKEACIVLYFFLRKLSDFMSFSDVLIRALNHEKAAVVQSYHMSGITLPAQDDGDHPQWFAFILSLLLAVRFTESKSATLKLLALLCGLSSLTYDVDLPRVFRKTIDVYSGANESALEAVTRDVLPSILTTQDLFTDFLLTQQKSRTCTTSSTVVILTLMQFGKRKGYVDEFVLPSCLSEYLSAHEAHNSSGTSYEIFARLLSHASASIRLGACELLLSSTSPTTPFPLGTLSCLAANLRYLHDDTDAYHRGELFSILRRFLVRVQQSHRALGNTKVGGSEHEMLDEYHKFHNQYLSFLRSEFSASNTYPRHILALQLLVFALNESPLQENSLQQKLAGDQATLTALFQLVLDPFEDVRALSAEAIAIIAQKSPQLFKHTLLTLNPLGASICLAATTNRADHADALGRIVSLVPYDIFASDIEPSQSSLFRDIDQLGQQLKSHISHLSAFDVSDAFPLHGIVLGVGYTIEKLGKTNDKPPPSLVETLLSICDKIWTLSQPHLCIDSPEMESEATEHGDTGPKDHLAYAWRALRDSNLMMQAMLEHFDFDYTLSESIGNICFNQLALLRHRGAFSTVAQTFVICCQKVRQAKDERCLDLIDRWFLGAMQELDTQAEKLTRRSAGLPAMFSAVFHPSDTAKFTAYFERLIEKATQPVAMIETAKMEDKMRLPQVHALNCVKDIMTSSRFRMLTEPLVVFTLNLAANCMSSSIWAVKNCGLMLLRASINRLDPDTGLGVSEAGIKQRALSKTARKPVDVAIGFLNNSLAKRAVEQTKLNKDDRLTFNESTEALFAGLDILSRLYIDVKELESIQRSVAHQLGNPLWHIRAQAARLLASLVPHDAEITLLRGQLSGKPHGENRIHGILMLFECLIQKLGNTIARRETISSMTPLLLQIVENQLVTSHAICMAKWLAVMNEVQEYADAEDEDVSNLLDAAEQVVTHALILSNGEHALCRKELATFGLHRYTLHGTMFAPTTTLLRVCEDDVFTDVLSSFKPCGNTDSMTRYQQVLMSLLDDLKTIKRRTGVMQAFTIHFARSQVPLASTNLKSLVGLLDFKEPPSRDLLNVQLTFYAALCRVSWVQNDAVILDSLASLSQGFCLHLRIAASDEIECDTRYSTIQALQLWKDVPRSCHMLQRLLDPTHQMDVFSVLYDLLNDDEDEIRTEASECVVALTQEVEINSFHSTSLCPAASRYQLRTHLSREFSNTTILRNECLRRVLGQRVVVSRSRLLNKNEQTLRHVSVESMLRPTFEAMGELFIEEKQNLYIDEYTELLKWAAMFNKSLTPIDLEVINKLAVWSLMGVEKLDQMLKGNHTWSSMLFEAREIGTIEGTNGLGPSPLQPKVMFGTSMTENLELLVARVVVGLRLSGNSGSLALTALRKDCVRLNMSQAVLSAFTWTLD